MYIREECIIYTKHSQCFVFVLARLFTALPASKSGRRTVEWTLSRPNSKSLRPCALDDTPAVSFFSLQRRWGAREQQHSPRLQLYQVCRRVARPGRRRGAAAAAAARGRRAGAGGRVGVHAAVPLHQRALRGDRGGQLVAAAAAAAAAVAVVVVAVVLAVRGLLSRVSGVNGGPGFDSG